VDLLKIETFPLGKLQCNCSLIYNEQSRESIIIDPGDDAIALLNLIEERDLKVKMLLHTHAHFDHIGCSKEVKSKTNSLIALHPGDKLLYKSLPMQCMMFGAKPNMAGTVDHWLEDNEEFSLNDSSLKSFLKTLTTPGHTTGSVSFYSEFFEEPILFSGDTLFQHSIGRTDLPGGDFNHIKKSIKERLYILPDETKVITGHVPQTRIFEEKRNNPFVNI